MQIDVIFIKKFLTQLIKMEAVWRFRIMLCMAFAIIIFGDFLGYGSVRGEKNINRQAPTALREKHPEMHLEDGKVRHFFIQNLCRNIGFVFCLPTYFRCR